MTLASLFHDHGLSDTFIVASTTNGPSSVNMPPSDEQPGPPLSQSSHGFVSGNSVASWYQ